VFLAPATVTRFCGPLRLPSRQDVLSIASPLVRQMLRASSFIGTEALSTMVRQRSGMYQRAGVGLKKQ
jgi:hypothetical protein